ncbi:MAG: hypothetical protein GY870_18285 [archaeon]|nr:hypothetical protein [archaeon]
MVNCTTHPERNATRKCYVCGKPICPLCLTQEVVGSRITSYSSVDSVTQVDYGFFCPSCFVNYGEERHYHKGAKGALTRFKARNIYPVTFLWVFFIIGIVVNLFSYPIGFYLWGGSGACLVGAEILAFINFKKYKRAFQLTKTTPSNNIASSQKQSQYNITSSQKQPQYNLSKPSDTNYCPKCGAMTEKDSGFCRRCGVKLN